MSRAVRLPSWFQARTILLLPEEACWRVVEGVFRWPLRAALAVVLLGLSPWATFRALGLAGLITLSGCVASVIGRGTAGRLRAVSLPKITRGRYRQRRFRSGWAGAMDAAKMTRPSKIPDKPPRMPRLGKVRMVTPDHLTARVDLSPTGNTPTELGAAQARILSKVRARTFKATTLTPSLARIDVRWVDPLVGLIHSGDLPPVGTPDAVSVGLTEDGEPFAMPILTPSLLVGEQGAGKSSQIWAFLDGLRRQGIPVRLRVFDPKGGQEFGELETCAHQYERDAGNWPKLIANMRSAMESRQASLRKRGVRKFTRFTPAEPLDVLLVDEWLTVKSQHGKRGGDRAQADTEHVLSQGRASGFVVVGGTQLGTKDMIGPLRDLFPNRYCLKVTTDDMVAAVLNVGANTYPAHEIQTKGVGYAYRSGHPIVRYRSAYADHGDIRRVTAWIRRQKTDREAAA